MTVRPATGLDEPAVLAAWVAAQAARGLPPSKARQVRVRAKLREPLALGLVSGDPVVGMLLAEPWRSPDGRLVAGVLHLSMLFVAPAAQRAGHGTALMTGLLARYPSVRVWSSDAGFFERLGFSRTGAESDLGVELESPALRGG